MTTVTFPSKTSKYEALVQLWNATKALGLGQLHSHRQPTIVDTKKHFDELDEYKSGYKSVDYFFGKPIKTNFANYPTLDIWGYDRDAGAGTMQKVANGCAVQIGSTKKLNAQEKKELFKKADESFKFVTM